MAITYHLFFHDDLDGILSAALFLRNHVTDRYRLYPVSSSWRGEKFNRLISTVFTKPGDKKVIIDYQYHPKSDIWIDHHYDPNFGECEVKNEKIFYNPKSPSAARLVNEYHVMINKPDAFDYDMSFISAADMIDSASYKSVSQIFYDKSPAMILRAYLERMFPSEMTYCRIVERIRGCNMNIKEALFTLRIGSFYVRELEKNALQIKHLVVISNKISIVNQKRKNQFPRYAEFLVFPNIKYSIRLTSVGNDNSYFQIGYNNWQKEPNEINIGKTVSEIDFAIGGGHYNVGAGTVKEENVNKLIDTISIHLNKEDHDMEKYAVDQNDAVEQKAAELVKTGSAKDMKDGREKATKTIKAEEVDGRKQDGE
jgi:hypothetical protein